MIILPGKYIAANDESIIITKLDLTTTRDARQITYRFPTSTHRYLTEDTSYAHMATYLKKLRYHDSPR